MTPELHASAYCLCISPPTPQNSMLSFILFAGSALVTSKVAQLRFGSQRAPASAAVMASSTVIETAAERTEELDVIVVGAGAAGVGTALMLTKNFGLDTSRVLLIERGEAVGDTFRRWPAEMRFISPSFNQRLAKASRFFSRPVLPKTDQSIHVREKKFEYL